MSYDILDKITVPVMFPCSNFVINHTVKLASKNHKGERQFFHSEYTYQSNQYINRKVAKSIKLSLQSFLTIEELGKDWTERETVFLNDLYLNLFIKSLKKTRNWFKKKKYDKLYYYENNKLKLNIEFNDLKEQLYLSSDKVIQFKPTVIDYNDEEYEGVIMSVNRDGVIGLITYDNLDTMYKKLKKFDLYMSGLELINYVRRPEFDEYNTTMSGDNEIDVSSTTSSFRNNKTEQKISGFFT